LIKCLLHQRVAQLFAKARPWDISVKSCKSKNLQCTQLKTEPTDTAATIFFLLGSDNNTEDTVPQTKHTKTKYVIIARDTLSVKKLHHFIFAITLSNQALF